MLGASLLFATGQKAQARPNDLYAFGLNRGGIDERWFGSTTEAANEGRVHDEGFSYVVHALPCGTR